CWQGWNAPDDQASSATRATAPAASAPCSSRTAKPSASRIGRFRLTALSYLDPGESPTTTKSVFLDTEEADLPPRDTIASVIESRVQPGSDPVVTIDRPVRVCSCCSPGSSAITQPAACHLSTIARRH